MEATQKSKVTRILGIVVNVLLYVFLGICVIVLALVVTGQNNDGATSLFGMQMRVVVSESMAPCDATDVSGFEIGSLPLNTMVFVEEKPEDEAALQQWYSELKVGDVLTFRYTYTTQVTITHRIKDIVPKDGGYVITLVGDNRDAGTQLGEQVIDTTEDANGYNYVIGKVVGSSLLMGLLVSFMKEPLALVLIVIVPCAIIIVMEVMRIVSMFHGEKSEKQKQQADEIEELKRRLEEMQSRMAQSEGAAEDQAQAPPAEQPEVTVEVTPVVVEIVEEVIEEIEESEDATDETAEAADATAAETVTEESDSVTVTEEERAPEVTEQAVAEEPAAQDERMQEDEQK